MGESPDKYFFHPPPPQGGRGEKRIRSEGRLKFPLPLWERARGEGQMTDAYTYRGGEGRTPVWIAARVLLHERVDDFFQRREKALKKSAPEEIHDLRVASRRPLNPISLLE